jgi:hypothetical protein
MSTRVDHVRIGIGVSSIGRFLPLIGRAAGLFEQRDIAVEVVNQQDEEKVVEDIAALRTPIGTPNAPSLIFSILGGSDLVIVGGVLNRPAFSGQAHRHQSAAPHGGHGHAGAAASMGYRKKACARRSRPQR